MSTVLYTSDTSNENSTISPTSEYSIIKSKVRFMIYINLLASILSQIVQLYYHKY